MSRENGADLFGSQALEIQAIFDSIGDAIWLLDTDSRIVVGNRAAEALFGKPFTEIVGRRCWEMVHHSDRPLPGCPVSRMFASGKRETAELMIGSGWYEVNADPIRNHTGRMVGAVHVITDISQRKRAEEGLRESEGKLRAVIEASPLGMHLYRIEADGRLIFEGSNPAADRILGVDHQGFVGQTIEAAFPQLASTEIPDRYRSICRDGPPWQAEPVEYADNQIMGAFEVNAFRTAPGRMAAVFQDITERKRSEVERQQLQEQLLQSQKMESIGRLAGGVAHDFNNLLSPILGYAEMMGLDGLSDERRREYAAVIVQAAQRAKELTQQLLTLSRKQVMDMRPLDLGQSVRGFEKLLRRTIREDIDIAVCTPAEAVPVMADAGQLHQLLMNLAVNAQDAMPGGGRLTVEVQTVEPDSRSEPLPPEMPAGPMAMLAVGDNGRGMDEQVKRRLFEPFFTTKEPGKGTGLGLSIVYGIVRQHDGCVTVHSEPHQGTSFRIYLPRLSGAGQRTDEAPEANEIPRGSETVLVVEDNPMMRDLPRLMLTHLGYSVLTAGGPEQGLEILGRHGRVQLLLTDVIMPGMNGYQLFERMRGLCPGLKVLFMSGYPSDIAAGPESPAESGRYLAKPFTLQILARRVRETLDA